MSFRIRRKQTKDPDKKSKRNYIASNLVAILVIWITTSWWPDLYPFSVFGQPFWQAREGMGDWVGAVWPIFAWGIGVNFLAGLHLNLTSNGFSLNRILRTRQEPSAIQILSIGTVRSLMAGVLEELAFRWLLYLSAISTLVFINWLWGTAFAYISLGLMGLALTLAVAKASSRDNLIPAIVTGMVCTVGLVILMINGGFLDPVKWLYEWIFRPFADWTSFGMVHELLYPPGEWAVGAAVVSANIFFRDGHKYQGPFGVLNAWFIGLVMFWVMFTYGVWPAIICHFLYDFLIYATVAFMRLFRH